MDIQAATRPFVGLGLPVTLPADLSLDASKDG